jgi:hypothetical protein
VTESCTVLFRPRGAYHAGGAWAAVVGAVRGWLVVMSGPVFHWRDSLVVLAGGLKALGILGEREGRVFGEIVFMGAWLIWWRR